MKLYEITGALRDVLSLDIPDEQKEDTLEELGLDLTTKIDGCLAYRQERLHYANSLKSEIDRLTALKKTAENEAASLESYVKRNMIALNMQKHQGLFSATLGKPSVRVEVTSELELPGEYIVTKYTPNKSKLSTDLKSGLTIPGAKLIEGEPRFLIK